MEAALPPAGTDTEPPQPPHALFECSDAELKREVERVHDELRGQGVAETGSADSCLKYQRSGTSSTI